MTPMTGIRMSGKISTGVRMADNGPMIRSSSASTTKVYGRFRAIRTSSVMAQSFLDLVYRMIMMQCGIYPKCRQIANNGTVKSLQFHANLFLARNGRRKDCARSRLMHQPKGVVKESWTAEVA